MKILITFLLVTISLTSSAQTRKRMICQIEICGPNSHVEARFSGDEVRFHFKKTRHDFHFADLLKRTGLLSEKDEVESMDFGISNTKCQFARGLEKQTLGDFACSGTVNWGRATIRELFGDLGSEAQFKFLDIWSQKSHPWNIEIKSMASSVQGPFQEYVWNLRLSHDSKSHEEQITIGQCTFE